MLGELFDLLREMRNGFILLVDGFFQSTNDFVLRFDTAIFGVHVGDYADLLQIAQPHLWGRERREWLQFSESLLPDRPFFFAFSPFRVFAILFPRATFHYPS